MRISKIARALSLISLAEALPFKARRNSFIITAQDIQSIASDTSTCSGAPFPTECATASTAAHYISLSFAHFNITSFGAQAALLSLMLYESGSFKYIKNHYPGVPGQGTRNMQSPAYNLEYATWVATYVPDAGFSLADVTAAEVTGPAAVLDLVLGETASFGSAAWFLKTQCDGSIEQGLSAGTEEGWESYLTTCVGTTVTADRTDVWKQAIALGKW